MNNISTILLVGMLLYLGGRYIYMLPKYGSGETAPSFEAALADGTPFKLEDLKGEYVLLDFWGSWCGPCRRESPGLVNLYKKYQDKGFSDAKGFEIVSVGIERREANWKRAIHQDNLFWRYHILDAGQDMRFFDSDIAGIYGVKQIPTKFLLDTEGNIIKVNPSIGSVDSFLEEKLK